MFSFSFLIDTGSFCSIDSFPWFSCELKSNFIKEEDSPPVEEKSLTYNEFSHIFELKFFSKLS